MGLLTDDELRGLGFREVGRHVRVSSLASIHRPERIALGDHVRIDDFCVLSAGDGGIDIGRYVHMGPHCILVGGGAIVMEDFSQLSARVTLLSSGDDIHGDFPHGAAIPEAYRRVEHAPIVLRRYSGAAAGCTVLAGAEIGEGTIVGAMSLVRETCQPYSLYAGIPARRIKERRRGFLDKIQALLADESDG
ncbi:MAG: acyltransferase [Myxococcota bacterium]